MKTYEEVSRMLEDIIDETPEQLFDGLTGGIIMSEEAKLHPDSNASARLYVMGEYQTNVTGSKIIIYYGSFMAVYGWLQRSEFREKLRHTFAHELRHHVEKLSGIKDLEKYDKEKLERFNSGIDIAEFHEPPIE